MALRSMDMPHDQAIRVQVTRGDKVITIRRATPADLEGMHKLIDDCAKAERLLPRSLNDLRVRLQQFFVAHDGQQVVGVAGLHRMAADLAEVRSLAVSPALNGQGIGKLLVQALLRDAARQGVARVFALTRQTDFFVRCGFREVTKELFPEKVWRECRFCPKLHHCDEIAMQYAGDLNHIEGFE